MAVSMENRKAKGSFLSRLERLRKKVASIAPRLPHHNMEHLLDVAAAAERIGLQEGLDDESIHLIQSAALLHDIIYDPLRDDNEERSAKAAIPILQGLGYSEDAIAQVQRLILATKPTLHPADLPEMIICDADIDYLGRDDYFDLAEKLRIEKGASPRHFYKVYELGYMSKARYHTKAAQQERQEKLKENLETLKAMDI